MLKVARLALAGLEAPGRDARVAVQSHVHPRVRVALHAWAIASLGWADQDGGVCNMHNGVLAGCKARVAVAVESGVELVFRVHFVAGPHVLVVQVLECRVPARRNALRQ